jgi:superfamily II DNA or RNA helicase
MDTMCRVTLAEDDELAWIQRYLSFEDVKFHGRARGRRVSMFSTRHSTFPGGLLQLVRDAASRDGVSVEERDRRTTRIVPDASADLRWLRDYQRDAVEACVVAKRGIVRAPTGSGKGDMIVGLVRRLPGCWLFLVHRDSLVDQQAKRFTKITGQATQELSRTPPRTWNLIRGFNLITLQSLAAGLRSDPEGVSRALSVLDGIIIDECHVAPADVYYDAIQRCPAEYRFGFSGTPLDRTDNRSLMAIAALGKVVYSIKATALIDAGVLAAPQITMVTCRQSPPAVKGGPTMRQQAAAAKKVYDSLIVESSERNCAVVRMVQEAEKPCMVFVKIVDHGSTLLRMLRSAGIETEFVWGLKTKEQRLAAVERLERGDAQALVASVVFQEGIDIPSLRSVVVASGGKSVIAALQRIGRGMRTDGGRKLVFSVYDVLDVGAASLERHARRRMNTYVRESYQTIVRSEDGSSKPYTPRLMTRKQKREAMP